MSQDLQVRRTSTMSQDLQVPIAVLYATRRSLAAAAELTDAEVKKAQWLKHIEEITKDLAPIQGEELTYEQQQWYDRKMASIRPKPYRPWPKTKKEFEFKTFSFAEVLASVEPLEETD
jgi:hypothetical protein